MRVLAIVFAVILLLCSDARATAYVVDDVGEAHDATPGDDSCDTGTGKCTLVAAIEEANAHAGADIIQLPPATYTFTVTLPTVTTAVTIQPTTGNDPSATVIQSSNTGHPRLFSVTTGGNLTLDTLTLENAQTPTGSAVQVTSAAATLTNCVVTSNTGTALYATASSSLTLTGCTISDNTGTPGPGGMWVDFSDVSVSNTTFSGNSGALGGAAYIYTASDNTHTDTIATSTFSGNSSTNSGGGVYVGSDTVTIDASTFTNNTTSYGLYGGGAIYAIGTLPGTIITNSTFTGNQATAATGGNGGAIFVLNRASCGGCTFSGNSATGSGGAVYAGANDGAEFDAVDSTFSGNTAFGGGGLSGTFKLASVTITNNTATGAHGATDPNGDAGGGGGTNGFAIQARNTIVAGNHSALGGADCEGQITSLGYDLVGDDTHCSVTASTGNQVGTGGSPIDAGLGALADNGGPTLTHALLAASPAGDAGDPSGCTNTVGVALATDQRGQPRSVDGNSDGTARCDVGAYEAPLGTFPTPTTTTIVGTTTTTTTTIPPTTTTTSSTTSSTTIAPTTTTSTTHAPTTSTTLAGDCTSVPDAPTFPSILCRFESLLALVNGSPGLGAYGPKSTATLQQGHDRAKEARDFCASSDAKHAKKRLKQVKRALIQYAHRLNGLSARKKLDPTVRSEVLAPVQPLEADVGSLRSTMSCPADGAP
jgi:parallel beta-helix repeat protein/predicted outer membrane repeat protein